MKRIAFRLDGHGQNLVFLAALLITDPAAKSSSTPILWYDHGHRAESGVNLDQPINQRVREF